VFGGHGYVSEWGIEQNVRDARIAMIYEGTNEIQAIDLLMRKVLADNGQGLHDMLNDMLRTIADPLHAQHPHAVQVRDLFEQLNALTQQAVQVNTRADGALTLSWIASDYLRLVALALLAWSWVRIEQAEGGDNERWQVPAQAFRTWVLPEFGMRKTLLEQQFTAQPSVLA